jgi:hypothetical protein
MSIERRNPQGWTDKGMKPGWMRRVPTPQDGKIKQLAQENAELKAQLEEQQARLALIEEKLLTKE